MNLVGVVARNDKRLRDVVAVQEVEHILEERHVAEWKQSPRCLVGQRVKPAMKSAKIHEGSSPPPSSRV